MQEVLEYVINKIEDAELKEVEGKPFWYMAIEDIFPADFYQDILKYTPKGTELYRPLSEMYKDRYKMELGYGESCDKPLASLKSMEKEVRLFWEEFQEYFIVKKDLANCFLQKYKDYIHQPSLGMIGTNCRLSKDLKGYSIGVHTDRRNKILSALFYTPNRNDETIRKEWGTQILVTKNTEFPHTTEKHHAYNKDGSHDLFDVYDWIECKPNSMFSWVVTQQSYHGVPPITIEGERDSIAFFAKATSYVDGRKLYGE